MLQGGLDCKFLAEELLEKQKESRNAMIVEPKQHAGTNGMDKPPG